MKVINLIFVILLIAIRGLAGVSQGDYRSGNIVMVGTTINFGFPVTHQPFPDSSAMMSGVYDVFAVKFDKLGERRWAICFGGSNIEMNGHCGLAIDSDANVIIAGSTWSSDFPVTDDAFQPKMAEGEWGTMPDTYLAKFDSNGMRLWATYFGGNGTDWCFASVDADENNNIIIGGMTTSKNFPVSDDAFLKSYAGDEGLNGDAFVAIFNPAGDRIWASYFGGRLGDSGSGVSISDQGHVVLTGWTTSYDFPFTQGCYQDVLAGASDAFIARFNFVSVPIAITGGVTNVDHNSAIVYGKVNRSGGSTTMLFEYGTTSSYGDTVLANQSPITIDSEIEVSASLTGLNASSTYHYRLVAGNSAGVSYGSDQTFKTSPVTEVNETPESTLPKRFGLGQNYPNPFNPVTSIPFAVPKRSEIKLKIFNLNGEAVKTIFIGEMERGYYSLNWNGVDNVGRQVSSGIYLYRLTSAGIQLSGKMILIR